MNESPLASPVKRKRQPGAGRKRKINAIKGLSDQIEAMLEVESVVNGEFRWTVASTSHIAEQMRQQGLDVSRRTIEDYLQTNGYWLNQNRNLPGGRGPEDVSAQFRVIGQAVRNQMTAEADVLLLNGKGKIFPRAVNHTEEASHDLPYEIRRIIAENETITSKLPDGTTMNVLRHLSPEQLESRRQQARDDIQLRLEGMVTDRNSAVFSAFAIRYWYNSIRSSAPTQKPILVLTYNASPDSAYPKEWLWVMNKRCQELNVPITIARIPSATWKFTGAHTKLFEFIAQDKPDKTTHGYTVTAFIAPYNGHEYDEIKTIPAIFDFRRFPKKRTISERMLKAVRVERNNLYGDWNYSFVPDRA